MANHNEIESYINPKTGRLKEGVENQLNHNPLIDGHICDSMEHIQSTMIFLMNFLVTEERNATLELDSNDQESIHALLTVSHSALKFENERAHYLMSKIHSHNNGKHQ